MSDDQEYYACKWLVEGKVAARKTKEVDMICKISADGKYISLKGTADCEHHLVEDAAILLKKMAAKICGEDHE